MVGQPVGCDRARLSVAHIGHRALAVVEQLAPFLQNGQDRIGGGHAHAASHLNAGALAQQLKAHAAMAVSEQVRALAAFEIHHGHAGVAVGVQRVRKLRVVPALGAVEDFSHGHGLALLCHQHKVPHQYPLGAGALQHVAGLVHGDAPALGQGWGVGGHPAFALRCALACELLPGRFLERLGLLVYVGIVRDQREVEQGQRIAKVAGCSVRPLQAFAQQGRRAEVQALGLPHAGIDQGALQRLPCAAYAEPAMACGPQELHQRPARFGDA